jgi:hypothetical protein
MQIHQEHGVKRKDMRMLTRVKNVFVPANSRDRRIVSGAFEGIHMQLCLHNQMQVYLGLWEREVYPWLERLSQGIATAVDIGAGEGDYTLFLLKKTHAKMVYAFEPNTQVSLALTHNLDLNDMGGTARLQLSDKFVGANCSEQQVALDSVKTLLDSPCLIKVDAEGHEEEILKGAQCILNAHPDVRWLIETHSKDLESACIRLFSASGFSTEVILNAWWRLFVPEDRFVEQNRWLAAWKELPGLSN